MVKIELKKNEDDQVLHEVMIWVVRESTQCKVKDRVELGGLKAGPGTFTARQRRRALGATAGVGNEKSKHAVTGL